MRPTFAACLLIVPALAEEPCLETTRSWELVPPVRVEAGGAPIDVEIGHAAPFAGEFDANGVPNLLVGQFGGGVLSIAGKIGYFLPDSVDEAKLKGKALRHALRALRRDLPDGFARARLVVSCRVTD